MGSKQRSTWTLGIGPECSLAYSARPLAAERHVKPNCKSKQFGRTQAGHQERRYVCEESFRVHDPVSCPSAPEIIRDLPFRKRSPPYARTSGGKLLWADKRNFMFGCDLRNISGVRINGERFQHLAKSEQELAKMPESGIKAVRTSVRASLAYATLFLPKAINCESWWAARERHYTFCKTKRQSAKSESHVKGGAAMRSTRPLSDIVANEFPHPSCAGRGCAVERFLNQLQEM